VVSAELYRILGNDAPQGAAASAIQRQWERKGKQVPDKPDYSPVASGGRTVSFFGDLVSPRSVFAIDHSTSMRQKTSLAGSLRGTVVAGEAKKGGPTEQKVTIVKRELVRCLAQLRRHYTFNVLGYNAKIFPWKAGGSLRLHPATSTNIRSATAFARELEVNRGTNIHDTLKAALPIPETETVFLLSDGVPSRGGKPPEIERTVRALNYLRGVRVITYGFAAEKRGSYDEGFMKRLAADNWGWYRRLNR
jgi:hypothetical protein